MISEIKKIKTDELVKIPETKKVGFFKKISIIFGNG